MYFEFVAVRKLKFHLNGNFLFISESVKSDIFIKRTRMSLTFDDP